MPTDRVYDPRHKLTDLPEWRSTDPTGLAGPGGAVQTANGARRRQGLAGLRDNAPSGRAAEPGRQGTHTPSPDGRAHIRRARARGTHTTSPGAGRAYDEAGASRAQQHDRAPAS